MPAAASPALAAARLQREVLLERSRVMKWLLKEAMYGFKGDTYSFE
jgi:hypothetical protein